MYAEAFDAGRFRLPSRYFFAPINCGFSRNGAPTKELVAFHGARSGRGIGVSYVGNIAVGKEFVTNSRTLYFGGSSKPWRELTDAIISGGSLAGAQIGCKLSGVEPPLKWRPKDSHDLIKRDQEMIAGLGADVFSSVINLYLDAAIAAWDCGFQVVQIHAAHGYFLSKLMNRVLNKRSDHYSVRTLEPLCTIVKAIKDLLPEVIIDVRLSIFDGLEPKKTERLYREEQIKTLSLASPDIISLSAGHYDVDRFLIYPRPEDGHAVYLDTGQRLAKQYPFITWNVAGNIWDLNALPENLPKNMTVSVGRPLIADPDFVKKALQGKSADINKCVRAGHCHYFTRRRNHIECKVNPLAANPTE